MHNVIHIMNTSFGKIDEYGARSKYVVDSSDRPFLVFARESAVTAEECGGRATITRVAIPVRYQFLRYLFAVLGRHDLKRRAVWKGFDRRLARLIAKSDLSDYGVLHTWEWVPETITVAKRKNPRIRIIRDVVVNRRHEYWSGTPIGAEEPVTNLFLSPSSFSTDCLLSWGIPRAKIAEIPFGVDCELFKPTYEDRGDKLRFAFSGGISKRKGIDSLLRVWKRLNLKNAELHLYGRVRDDVRADLEGAPNVVCHGHMYLPDELPRNHAFVFPSTLEGSAKSVYEALACGLPTVTTPESGSIVRDGIDGFLVPKADDERLAEVIAKLCGDEGLLREMSRAARERATEYPWSRYAKSVLGAYDRLDDADMKGE